MELIENPKTADLFEENLRENLYSLESGKYFLNVTPKLLSIKEQINKLSSIKI